MTYVLETKNLKKKYKNTQALDGVDIKLEKGNIYGFVGQNGAGKNNFNKTYYWLIISYIW
ncbi:ABC-type multidrug transport system ATPase subunit [Clostridium beijerinckii]|nr:ABC-type multidrug transport system ATPase subunit [Clostridium beijerinckii]NRZ58263.1 ABC-type multidrug transport system ATPase subunit [Clostridium beijerinckii]